MFLRRFAALLCLLLCAVAFPTNTELVFAGGKPVLRTSICHDGVWDDGEYCGRDAYVTTFYPEMNHDCIIDGLDVGLFLDQLYTSGPNLSADFNDDGTVDVFNDYFVFAPKVGSIVDPCNGSPTPSVNQGTISLSMSPDPQTIVTNPVLGVGRHDIYVVINGFTNAKFVEYAIYTGPNMFIVADSMMVPGQTGPSCNTGTYNVVHAFTTPIVSGPVTINRFTLDVTAFGSGTLSIAPANCSWGHVRWAHASADVSYEFNHIQNMNYNQPGTYGTVTGKAYIDYNGDCAFNVGDTGVADRLVVTSPGSFGTKTDANGNYALSAPPGSYSVTFAPVGNDPWTFSPCQGPYNVTITAGNTVVGKNFGLAPTGTISGKVYWDAAPSPCAFDPPLDHALANRLVIANPGNYKTVSQFNGDYFFLLPPGNFGVQYSPSSGDPWGPNNCQPVPLSVTSNLNTSPNNNIALVTSGPAHCGTNLNFYVAGPTDSSCPTGHPWLTSCPNHESEYEVVLDADAANTAVMPANTTLDIVLDPSFTINDFACNLPFHELAGAGPNNKKINLDNELVPGVTVIAVLHATPSTDGPYHAHVTFDDLGGCGGIKTRDLDEVSFCSCDPNDLEVDPAGCGENHEVTGDARFTYRVRFENIGEGAAHNIVVRDVIDPALDTSTLRVITSSHKVTSWQVGPNNELVVRFDNINLAGTIGPGRNTGFVMFKADPLPNLPVGTVIHNSADVTFDYNSPLATNVVSNKIVAHPCEVVAVKPAVLSTYLGQNYPNPFNPSTTIEYGLKSRSEVSIGIYNVNGQLIRVLVSESKPAGIYSIEWDGRDQRGTPVASGVYLSRMRAGAYLETKKLLLLK